MFGLYTCATPGAFTAALLGGMFVLMALAGACRWWHARDYAARKGQDD